MIEVDPTSHGPYADDLPAQPVGAGERDVAVALRAVVVAVPEDGANSGHAERVAPKPEDVATPVRHEPGRVGGIGALPYRLYEGASVLNLVAVHDIRAELVDDPLEMVDVIPEASREGKRLDQQPGARILRLGLGHAGVQRHSGKLRVWLARKRRIEQMDVPVAVLHELQIASDVDTVGESDNQEAHGRQNNCGCPCQSRLTALQAHG